MLVPRQWSELSTTKPDNHADSLQFHSFSAQSTGVDAGPFTDQYSQCAVLDMVDGATTGMTTRSILDENLLNLVSFAPGSDGAISAGEAGESRIAHITPGGIGMDNTVGPAQVSKMLGLEKKSDLGLDVNADVNVDLNLQKKNDLGLDVNADVNADLALDTRQLGVGANANADVRVDLNAAANLGLGQKKRQIQAGSSTGAGAAAAALAKVAAKADINVDINARDVRRSRQPADKRVTYTTGDYTTTIDDDGKGTSSFSVTSPKVNLTTQSAPGGAAFNIQLPDDLFDNASQAGQDAISSLGLKRADIKHELHSISGVASSGATGIQMGDSTNSVGGSSSANVAAAIKEMQSRSEVEARQGNLLNGLPIVGGLLGGALKRDEIEPRQGNLLKGLPIVGGLLGGALKRDVVEERQGNLLNGLPIVGGLLGGALKRDEVEERQGNLLNGLPIVGGLLGGALKRDEVEERQGNLLNGLPIVGGLLGGALKRDVVEERQGNLLNGLPIVGGLLGGALKRDEVEERQGNLLNGLPIVGGLLGGALKRDEVEERQGNLLNGLPIVGDLLGGALKKRVHSPMAAGEYKKRHFRSRARRQANGVVVA